jgi:hypothetical protein
MKLPIFPFLSHRIPPLQLAGIVANELDLRNAIPSPPGERGG